MAGSVLSVNVGMPREIEWLGRRASTSIWKEPVTGRVPARRLNLAGDEQADPRFHGGADKAVYAYAREDYDWWAEELGRPLAAATFGENLTLAGRRRDVRGRRRALADRLGAPRGHRPADALLEARRAYGERRVPGLLRGRRTAGRLPARPRGGRARRRRRGRPCSTSRATGSRSATWPRSTTATAAAARSCSGRPEIGEEWRAWVRDRLAGAHRRAFRARAGS